MALPQFRKIDIPNAFPSTQWWECQSCGRQYYDMPECDDFFSADRECPAEDCPSHWEELGISHHDP